MRSTDSVLLNNNIVRNPFVWGAIAVSAGLLALAIFFPPLASLLGLERPATSQAWILAVAGGLAPLLIGQIAIAVLAHRHRD